MFRFIAFLRAINVGHGRTVKMQSLRQVLESLGFSGVATFIASGTLSLRPPRREARRLKERSKKYCLFGCSLCRSPKVKPAATVRRLILTCTALALPLCLTLGKRTAPAEVTPVIHESVRYVAPNDNGRRGYIEARDVHTNGKIWELTVFTNRIDPNLEEDVQWVFIQTLSIRDNMLIVTSERGDMYGIDLKTKAIMQLRSAQSQTVTAQPRNIPELVQAAVTNGSLAKGYDVSFDLIPSYLQGDFNGDGNIDVAVLVKQRATGKLGIAIVHGGMGKTTILGAGTAIGNGGDDFAWMDSWQLYAKNRAAHAASETNVLRLRGDALLVSKTEAASALIYWNGKAYVWLQQGD